MENSVLSFGQILFALIVTIVLKQSVQADTPNTWYAFQKENDSLVGFRDSYGNIRIEAKFLAFVTPANKFDAIISTAKIIDNKLTFFYLTKSGKEVGRDSAYSFEGSHDCENEGFIRFEYRNTGKIGLLNREGRVAVPAEYDGLTRVVNGMAVGLKGARKEYWDHDHEGGCEHFSWVGGDMVLIDTNNVVLVDGFKYMINEVDFFSKIETPDPINNQVRINIRASNGLYYSFVDFSKEFKQWLQMILNREFSQELVKEICYDNVVIRTKNKGRACVSQSRVISHDYDFLKKQFEEIKHYSLDSMVEPETFSSYVFDHESFAQFFNNCSGHEDYKYPCMSVNIGKNLIERSKVNSFEFLRTKDGYKLVYIWKNK